FSTLPVFPLSLPARTMTLSPFLIFIRIYLHHIWGEGYDLLITGLRKVARDRTEHPVSLRLLLLLVDQGDGVVVERDVRTVNAAERLLLTDDHAVHDVLLLHLLARLSGLDREDHHLAEFGVALL